MGLAGGAYNSSSNAMAGVYENFATRSTTPTTDSHQFGVVGDILLLGVGSQPDATGGVLGAKAEGDFGILDYVSKAGTNYSVYGGNSVGTILGGGGRTSLNSANNLVGFRNKWMFHGRLRQRKPIWFDF